MRIERTSADLADPKEIELANQFLDFESVNFSDQVAFLKLDPKQNFRFADLSYVDFSRSDLRGFDFSGAVLRGTTGVDVTWDDTTNFADADTADSCFSYLLGKKAFFRDHPEYAEQVTGLTNDYWANTILIIEAMLRADKTNGDALRIARAVFDETDDITVRSELLLYMALGVETRDEHKAFIYNTLAEFYAQPKILRSSIRTLRSLYVNDRDAFNLLTKYIDHPDEKVSQEAVAGVLSSQHFMSAGDDVRASLLTADSSLVRRAYVGRVAKAELKQYADILLDNEFSAFVDFAQLISNDKIERMARKSFLIERLKGLQAKQVLASLLDRDAPALNEGDRFQSRARMIKTVLVGLRHKYGIPFKLDKNPISAT